MDSEPEREFYYYYSQFIEEEAEARRGARCDVPEVTELGSGGVS